MPHELTGKRGI